MTRRMLEADPHKNKHTGWTLPTIRGNLTGPSHKSAGHLSRSINDGSGFLRYGQARLQPGSAHCADRGQRGSGCLSRDWRVAGPKRERLTLAAGAPSGESYILGHALKTVVERHYPKIRIDLLETGGTVENLKMLEDGRAQLAAAQSDIPPGPKARAVTVLYDDTFQLLVPKIRRYRVSQTCKADGLRWPKAGGNFSPFFTSPTISAFDRRIFSLSAQAMRVPGMHS